MSQFLKYVTKKMQGGGDIGSLPGVLSLSAIQKNIKLNKDIKNQKALNSQATLSQYTPKPGDQERMNRAKDRYRTELTQPLNRLANNPNVVAAGKNLPGAAEFALNAMTAGEAGAVLNTIAKPALKAAGRFLTKETALKNAYKLNPYAFKPSEGMMYRGLGKEGMEDAFESGVFRAKQDVQPSMVGNFDMSKRFDKAYFSPRFDVADQYGQGYIAEVPRSASDWGRRYGKKEWSQIAQKDIPITEGKILQKDWLKGYKQVSKPERIPTSFYSEPVITRGPIANPWDGKGIRVEMEGSLDVPEGMMPYIGRVEYVPTTPAEKVYASFFQGKPRPIPPPYKKQRGGTAYIDSVFNAPNNKQLEWVQRLYQKNGKSIMVPGQTEPSTHFMESGDGRVYPTVVTMPDGSLKYLGKGAYDYADSTKTYIQFPTDKQAQWFGKNYKTGTGVLSKKKDGGPIVDPRGQWAHPGKVTRIPGSDITMQGVPYPVYGVGSNGQEQMMYPDQEYDFGGASYVDEYPMMQGGGSYRTKEKDASWNWLNPLNWGVPDYSDKGNFDQAYALARKNNDKQFMYGSKRIAVKDGGKQVSYRMIEEANPQFTSRYKAEMQRMYPADADKRYQDMLDLHLRYGNPKVNMVNEKGRAFFSIPSNAMTIYANDPIGDYISEMNHSRQRATMGPKALQQKQIADMKRNKVVTAEDYDNTMYDDPNSIEGVHYNYDFPLKMRMMYRQYDLEQDESSKARAARLKILNDSALGKFDPYADQYNIRALQRALHENGYALPGSIKADNTFDGIYGKETKAALEAFKRKQPKMESGGQHGGLDRWFAEKWVDVKTGKDCGRQDGEKRKGYPACRPSRRVNEDTPKTASELSSSEREKFKREKTSSERINYQHRRKEYGGETNEQDMANKPNNPALWSRAKSLAKSKFDVYPSAYANGWAAKWYKGKGGTWSKAEYGMEVMGEGGTPDNAGFRALPPAVQQKIMDNMAEGGEKMPPEIARARFAAAGNLDKMSDYGYGYGGYIPEVMAYGGSAQQAAIAIAMKKAGKKPKQMKEGGDPDGEMALGQIDAAIMKLSQLRKFIQPESDLEPWVNSKLTLMDDYASAVSDYMMHNPEAEEEFEEMGMMAKGGYVVTRSNDRKGKTHKVTGPDGTVKYFGDSKLGQHPNDPERKAAFYARHEKNLKNNPHFRAFARKTWADGGEIEMMANGGYIGHDGRSHMSTTPTWSGNMGYKMGGGMPCYECGGMFAEGGMYDCPDQEKDPVTGKCAADVARGKEAAAANKAAAQDMNAWAKQVAAMDKANAKQDAAQYAGQMSFDYDWMGSPVDKAEKKAAMAQYKQFFQQNPNTFVADDTSGFSPEQKYIIASKLKQKASTPMGSKAFQQKFKQDPNFFDLKRLQSDIVPMMGGWDATRNYLFGNKKYGGPAVGAEMDVTPEQLEALRQQGYEFEII